jgi:hypothetical protein
MSATTDWPATDEGYADAWTPDDMSAAEPVTEPGREDRAPLAHPVSLGDLSVAQQSANKSEVVRERAKLAARELMAAEKAEADALVPAMVVADVEDLPHSLLGERAEITQEEIEEAMKTRPVSLLDALRMARKEKATPTLLALTGDVGHLLYRGKSNGLSGESGEGKSMIAKLAVLQEARAGRASLTIDREKDIAEFAEKIVELGDVTDEQAALIFYWSPQRSTCALMPTILGFCKKYDIDLVALDSVSRDMSVFSATASENSNDDVRRWYTACVEPILRLGRTPLLIDHVVKPPTGQDGKSFSSDSLYAKGAVAKREILTGHALMMRSVKSFSKDVAGWAKLISAKDNSGSFTRGAVVAEFHVTPGDERSTFELRPNMQPVDAEGNAIPTILMEKLSRFLEGCDEAPSKSQMMTAVGGNTKSTLNGLDRLVASQHVRIDGGGPGKAMHLVSLKPFRRSDLEVVVDEPPATPVGRQGGKGYNRAF